MTTLGCDRIALADLTDYAAGELPETEAAAIEDHLFSCAECGARAAELDALVRAIRPAIRSGQLGGFVTDAVVNRLAREGVRMRFALSPGAVVPCAVWDDDELMVFRLRGDFSGASGRSRTSAPSTTLTTSPRRFAGCAAQVMMATVPRAPQNFVGAINGRQVTLSWINPGNTTHFDIEVGSAAGLSNILTRSLSGTTFTVDGVPSGRYFVRLRAINDVGRSLPTADVEVVVP